MLSICTSLTYVISDQASIVGLPDSYRQLGRGKIGSWQYYIFIFFALSFWIEAANRIAMIIHLEPNEGEPGYYVVRLVAYGLIVAAIVDKNRAPR